MGPQQFRSDGPSLQAGVARAAVELLWPGPGRPQLGVCNSALRGTKFKMENAGDAFQTMHGCCSLLP